MSDEELKQMTYQGPELHEIGDANELIFGDPNGNRKDSDQTGLEYAC